mgnify:CR=1 FL=1
MTCFDVGREGPYVTVCAAAHSRAVPACVLASHAPLPSTRLLPSTLHTPASPCPACSARPRAAAGRTRARSPGRRRLPGARCGPASPRARRERERERERERGSRRRHGSPSRDQGHSLGVMLGATRCSGVEWRIVNAAFSAVVAINRLCATMHRTRYLYSGYWAQTPEPIILVMPHHAPPRPPPPAAPCSWPPAPIPAAPCPCAEPSASRAAHRGAAAKTRR